MHSLLIHLFSKNDGSPTVIYNIKHAILLLLYKGYISVHSDNFRIMSVNQGTGLRVGKHHDINHTERAKTSEGSSFFVTLLFVVRLATTLKVQALLSAMGLGLPVEADHAASGHAQLTDKSVAIIRSIAFLRVAPSKVKKLSAGLSV